MPEPLSLELHLLRMHDGATVCPTSQQAMHLGFATHMRGHVQLLEWWRTLPSVAQSQQVEHTPELLVDPCPSCKGGTHDMLKVPWSCWPQPITRAISGLVAATHQPSAIQYDIETQSAGVRPPQTPLPVVRVEPLWTGSALICLGAADDQCPLYTSASSHVGSSGPELALVAKFGQG